MAIKKLDTTSKVNTEEDKYDVFDFSFSNEEIKDILSEYYSTGMVSDSKFNSVFEVADTVAIAKKTVLGRMREHVFREGIKDFYRVLDAPDSVLELNVSNDENTARLPLDDDVKDKVKADLMGYLPSEACNAQTFVICAIGPH